MRDDKIIVLKACKVDGSCIKFASARLQHDREVMLAAVAQCGGALKCVTSRGTRRPRARARVPPSIT